LRKSNTTSYRILHSTRHGLGESSEENSVFNEVFYRFVREDHMESDKEWEK